MYLAETLSRGALPDPVWVKVPRFEVCWTELSQQANKRNRSLIKATERKTTSWNQEGSHFFTVTKSWPNEKQKVATVQHCWNYWDELKIQIGIIYKFQPNLIPEAIQVETLKKIHVNNLWPESNIRKARKVLFWPGMRKAIQNTCSSCGDCFQCGWTLTKRSMKSIPLPSLPWKISSQDLFEIGQQRYLVTVCHFSDWVEWDELCTRYFERTTTSCLDAQILTEHFVQNMKKILERCKNAPGKSP